MDIEINKELIDRFFSRETSPEESDALGKWLRKDSSHREEFDRAYDSFMITQMCLDADAAAGQRESAVSGPHIFRRIVALVSGIAAAVLLGGFISYRFFSMPELNRIGEMSLVSETGPGQRTKVTLSDGTCVTLNSGSRLVYQPVFLGDERRVKLDGEAVFEVAHNEGKPFIVEAFACDIKVLGTKFDVISDSARHEFSTALIEGKVRIQDKGARKIVDLESGSMVLLSGNKFIKSAIRYNDSYLWTDGVISAGGRSFGEIMERFRRCYGVNIVVDAENMPQVCYPYLKLRISEGIEHAFEMLKLNCEFDYSYEESTNTYFIN